MDPARTQAQPTLTTARLVLRPLVAGDATVIRALAGVYEVAGTTVNIPHPYPEGAAEAFIAAQARLWHEDGGATWAIALAGADDTLIGCIGAVGFSRKHARCRLGYWIAHGCWNRGYATEAAGRVVEFAFADGIYRVEADHLSRNPASGRVMQKIGMRHEGRLRAFYRRFDRFEDVELYARLRDDR